MKYNKKLEDALVLKMGGTVRGASEEALIFSRGKVSDIVRDALNLITFNPDAISERAMKTADFPELLLGAGRRIMEQEFEATAITYAGFVTEVDVNDFRENIDITRGSGGRLDKYHETGELKEKHLGESAEKWYLESYGNKFVLTRKMIINDDLGAFSDMARELGQMAALTANGIVFDMLTAKGDYASYKMSDGKAIFDPSHDNATSKPLDSTSLALARSAMRMHKGIDGKTLLNITPSFLIVGPDLEQTAYELIHSSAKVEDNKSSGVANYHEGSLKIIVDAEIIGDSWYLSANRKGIKVGYLAGTHRKPVIGVNISTQTKTEFEGIFDFGIVCQNYKGLFKGK